MSAGKHHADFSYSADGAENRINRNFMREMISHRMGAVRMLRTALESDICSELKPFLHSIITQRQRDITIQKINK